LNRFIARWTGQNIVPSVKRTAMLISACGSLIRYPLAAPFPANDLPDVRTDREQPRAEILGKQAARLRSPALDLIIEEAIDLPQARCTEVGHVPG
jgi:hypothetical protein